MDKLEIANRQWGESRCVTPASRILVRDGRVSRLSRGRQREGRQGGARSDDHVLPTVEQESHRRRVYRHTGLVMPEILSIPGVNSEEVAFHIPAEDDIGCRGEHPGPGGLVEAEFPAPL